MYQIAARYNSSKELKMKEPKIYDAMRKRINLYEFYDETPQCHVTSIAKHLMPNERPKPNMEAFALQFYWQTAFPSAIELEQREG